MLTKRRLNNLREVRKYGIGRLLLLARRDFLNRLAQKMGDAGGPSQVWSRGRLLPYIDIEGTRSTEVARRLGISKQAVARVVRELEEDGLLARTVDEADGRAWLITFTDSGLEYLMRMHEAIRKVERDYEEEFGGESMRVVKETLGAIAYPAEAAPATRRSGERRVRAA
jgi:DNA-binding MarR family transcriptional regulator